MCCGAGGVGVWGEVRAVEQGPEQRTAQAPGDERGGSFAEGWQELSLP